jgi:hypothetical protein
MPTSSSGAIVHLGFPLHRQTQKPVPDRILREAPALPLHPLQTFPLEHPEALAGKAHTLAFALKTIRLEGYPPERTPGPLLERQRSFGRFAALRFWA